MFLMLHCIAHLYENNCGAFTAYRTDPDSTAAREELINIDNTPRAGGVVINTEVPKLWHIHIYNSCHDT